MTGCIPVRCRRNRAVQPTVHLCPGLLPRHGTSVAPPKYLERDLPTATEQGRRWLRKALHPADPAIKAERVPAGSRYPTVVQEIVSRFTIEPPPGLEEDTWGFRLIQTTDPICPIVVTYLTPNSSDPWETGSYCNTWLNPVFSPAATSFGGHSSTDFENALTEMKGSCETYRITALSTTGEFTGASLTDQGSIVAVQFQDHLREMSHIDFSTGVDTITVTAQSGVIPQTFKVPIGRVLTSQALINTDPLPTLSVATMASHPYSEKTKEGWYMPQKLSAPGTWHSMNDTVFRGRLNPTTAAHSDSAVFGWFGIGDLIPWPANGNNFYPTNGACHLWIAPCDDGTGMVFGNNIHKSSSFQVIVRMNLELGVSPLNEYAPFAEPSPPPDPLAIDMYNEIVKEMLDAYPSRDNANSTLINKIVSIGRKVAAIVEPVAGIASMAGVPYANVISRVAGMIAASEKPADLVKNPEFQVQAAQIAEHAIAVRQSKVNKRLDAQLLKLAPDVVTAKDLDKMSIRAKTDLLRKLIQERKKASKKKV